MSDKIQELFEQYHQSFLATVNSDDFFTFLMNAIQSGDNEMSFLMKKLNKNIDMRWVEVLEDCIIPLDTIIRNPRRFIVQEDEVVPIHLSKKVTPDSVRHLAQHTHYISKIEREEIQPNKILNVSREDTIDIYENRFIYTLLQKLKTFLEKRTNVLFASMDDEEMAHIVMKGQFSPQQGEKVEYSVDLSTVTRPYMGGDELNPRHMAPLARIDRINQYLQSFMYSSFVKEMRGCALVRPPIMRTNVIMKEPNFKKCLALWQFIEGYDEIGYTIESFETEQLPEKESLAAIYSGLAMQYVFVKQSAGQIEEAPAKKPRKKQLHPKFVQSVVEEIVRDFDVTETEVRRVFLDEIAKVSARKEKERQQVADAINMALLWDKNRRIQIEEAARRKKQEEREAERRRREREKARIEKQKALEKAKKEREREKARLAKEKAIAAEKARKEKERLAKERERAAKAKALALEKEKIAKAKQRERERIAREKAAALEKERLAKERAREKARIAKEKAAALEAERIAKEKERARIAKEKAAALEAERIAKEKERARLAKEKAKAEKEKALALEKERAAKARQKERERVAKEKAIALEKERAAKEKAKEKERLAREKAIALEKERIAKEKEKARLAREKEKALEKERAAKARQKERERVAKEKAIALEKERIAKEKAREKERIAKEKTKAAEAERLAKEKEKARLAREKEKALEKERAEKERQKQRERIAKEKALEKERLAKENQSKSSTDSANNVVSEEVNLGEVFVREKTTPAKTKSTESDEVYIVKVDTPSNTSDIVRAQPPKDNDWAVRGRSRGRRGWR